MYQYRCACCEHVVSANDKSCPSCGSHNIRSPFGFWFFCFVACFILAVGVVAGKKYFGPDQDDSAPKKVITDIIQSGKNILSN